MPASVPAPPRGRREAPPPRPAGRRGARPPWRRRPGRGCNRDVPDQRGAADVKARWGAAALVAFLVPVTLVFHNFWAYLGAEAQLQTIQFLKDVSIGGGPARDLPRRPGCAESGRAPFPCSAVPVFDRCAERFVARRSCGSCVFEQFVQALNTPRTGRRCPRPPSSRQPSRRAWRGRCIAMPSRRPWRSGARST